MFTDKAQIKIAILAVYSAISAEVNHIAVQESIVSTGNIDVFEFTECENELIEEKMLFIVKGDKENSCGITPLGESMFAAGKDIIRKDTLDEYVEKAIRHFEYICTGKKYTSEMIEGDGGFYVSCSLRSKQHSFMEAKLFFQTRKEALETYNNCLKNPEVVFKGLETLMTGKINHLL